MKNVRYECEIGLISSNQLIAVRCRRVKSTWMGVEAVNATAAACSHGVGAAAAACSHGVAAMAVFKCVGVGGPTPRRWRAAINMHLKCCSARYVWTLVATYGWSLCLGPKIRLMSH